MAKLRAYLKAFSIQAQGALEKDDIVQAILDVRVSETIEGCGHPFAIDTDMSTAFSKRTGVCLLRMRCVMNMLC